MPPTGLPLSHRSQHTPHMVNSSTLLSSSCLFLKTVLYAEVGGRGDPRPSPSPPASSSPSYQSDWSQLDKDVVFEGLKRLYRSKVLPLELASQYAQFASPPLGPSDFDAKPMVLVLGQYSVGKTSFIRSLLQRDFPGQRIGPEPTTDRFTAILHAEGGGVGRLVPGHALVMQSSKPFRGLASFGN
ncbi:hypothetical protein EON64_19740, partial [archaeon]